MPPARSCPRKRSLSPVGRGLAICRASHYGTYTRGKHKAFQVPWRAFLWLAFPSADGASPTVLAMRAPTTNVSRGSIMPIRRPLRTLHNTGYRTLYRTHSRLVGCTCATHESNSLARDERFQFCIMLSSGSISATKIAQLELDIFRNNVETRNIGNVLRIVRHERNCISNSTRCNPSIVRLNSSSIMFSIGH